MQFGYIPPRQALAENLLINPRGIINQASEPDGVIAAGDYFCDGWKAGAAGCEVYRLAGGGFDLRSGSIVQLVPNNLEATRLVRTNLDIVTGSPVITVNGSVNKAQASDGEYIEIEISGNNSQFNRIVAADSHVRPIYQQQSDELFPCYRFLFVEKKRIYTRDYTSSANGDAYFPVEMLTTPAVTLIGESRSMAFSSGVNFNSRGFHINSGSSPGYVNGYIADARP